MSQFYTMKEFAESLKKRPDILNQMLDSEEEYQIIRAKIAAQIANSSHRRLTKRKIAISGKPTQKILVGNRTST